MTAFLEDNPCLWQLITRYTLQIIAFGFQMNPQPQACKVQNCWNYSSCDDINIRHTYKLRHEKSSSAHYWWHQLTTSGGCGLNGSRKFLAIAQLFHHWDSKASGAGNISNGASGYSTHKGTGKYSYLCRTAAGPTSYCIGNIDEEFAQSS